MTEKDYLKHIGSRVRDARVERGISAHKLSYMIDLSPRTLSFIETGKANTGILTIYKIAAVLNMDMRDLI